MAALVSVSDCRGRERRLINIPPLAVEQAEPALTLNDICLAMSAASACTLSSRSPSARAVLLHTPHTGQHQSVELQVGGAVWEGQCVAHLNMKQ